MKVSGKTSKQPAKDREELAPVNSSRVSHSQMKLTCLNSCPIHFSMNSTQALSCASLIQLRVNIFYIMSIKS